MKEITNSCSKKKSDAAVTKANTKKKGQVKERKRKRVDGDEEDETDEDEEPSVTDGEKVFQRSRTSKTHYQDIVKEMEYLRDMPPSMIIPSMIDWVLACEIRRSKSKNINGTVARQMREYLIKLYCAIGEIQRQKENNEAKELKKQMENMRMSMMALKEENANLKRELETIKEKISTPAVIEAQQPAPSNKMTNQEGGNVTKAKTLGAKETSSTKRLSQPSLTPMERRNKNQKFRRELSYPMDAHSSSKTEEEERERDIIVAQSKRKKKESTGKQNKERKRSVRMDSLGDSGLKKNKNMEKTPGKRGE